MLGGYKIGFIGAGNMSSALAEGLLRGGIVEASELHMADRNASRREFWTGKGARVYERGGELIGECEIVFIGIKPQGLAELLEELKGVVAEKLELGTSTSIKTEEFSKEKPIIVSILAGTRVETLEEFFKGLPIVRVMPNLPATIGFGTSGIYANDVSGARVREVAEAMINSSGLCVWVDKESKIDEITSISGSGPAYFFQIFEIMQEEARAQGFTEAEAKELVLQTALGSTNMALGAEKTARELREMVTSKGGTTFAALESFRAGGLSSTIRGGMQAALSRARELSKL